MTLFALEEPIQHAVPQHLQTAYQCVEFLERERPAVKTLISKSIVPGAFDPFLARKLESMAPPRPHVHLPNPLETRASVLTLLKGLQGGLELLKAQNWDDIEAHFVRQAKQPTPVMPYIRSLHQVRMLSL